MSLVGVGLFNFTVASADTTMIYPGSEDFTSTPIDWLVNIKVDEISGIVTNLVEVYKDDNDVSGGILEGIAEIGPLTSPAFDAQASPINSSDPAFGRARVFDTMESIGDASGLFTGDNGERLRITSTSRLEVELEYGGSAGSVEADAVVCLMPMQLAVVTGSAVTPGSEAVVTYAYSLEIDGEEVFSSSMSLTQSDGNPSLSALEGSLRTDGVFFQDNTYSTFGFNFPAATYTVPIPTTFYNGEPLEALMTFTTIVEAPDSNWGGYAGPSGSGVDPNGFVATAIPEPQVAGFLAAGFVLSLLRRRR